MLVHAICIFTIVSTKTFDIHYANTFNVNNKHYINLEY